MWLWVQASSSFGLSTDSIFGNTTTHSQKPQNVSVSVKVFKMGTLQGYKCELVDTVPYDLYCKKCALVARKLVITECCGESYCHSCITAVLDQAKPCPACKDDNFTVFQHKKSQKRINSLQVYCIMKERGCVWSGTVEQLDTRIDHNQDNCQYVDTSCLLNCQQTIPKNNMDDHLAQHCVKRAYVCQFCSFKATYEEIVDTHLPQCKYVPLDCPNKCGVTFVQDFLEDHMKICRLEEVACEFRILGCDNHFPREDQKNHARENSDKHLTLTASLAVETKDSLIKKLLDQDERHKEEEQKLKEKIKEQEQQLTQQKQHINDLQSKVDQTEEDYRRLRQQLQGHDKKFAEVQKSFELNVKSLEQNVFQSLSLYAIGLKHSFVMTDFSKEKLKDKPGDWKCPAMYTHTGGYKFCIGVDANGSGRRHGSSINAEVWSMPGEYDNSLKWPVLVDLTIEIINQHGGPNVTSRIASKWGKPTNYISVGTFGISRLYHTCIMMHTELHRYLNEDSLYFNISHITVI